MTTKCEYVNIRQFVAMDLRKPKGLSSRLRRKSTIKISRHIEIPDQISNRLPRDFVSLQLHQAGHWEFWQSVRSGSRTFDKNDKTNTQHSHKLSNNSPHCMDTKFQTYVHNNLFPEPDESIQLPPRQKSPTIHRSTVAPCPTLYKPPLSLDSALHLCDFSCERKCRKL